MASALVFSLALSLWVFFNGEIKPFKNKWILIFIGYLMVNIYFSPKINIMIFDNNVGNIWVWHSISHILIFAMALISISSIDFDAKTIKLIFNIMTWCGLVMAVYCILQALCIEQFFALMGTGIHQLAYDRQICGTLGHQTIVSPFMAMIIPIAIYSRKYWQAIVIAIAVIITMSQVAIGAMVISLMFYFGVKGKRNLIAMITLGLIIISGYAFYKPLISTIDDHGRFIAWKILVKDMTAPSEQLKYPITGVGIGSFAYTFHIRHPHDKGYQAHNEYLEVFWNTGLVGLFIFISGIFYIWKQNFSLKDILNKKINKYRMTLLASFLCISLCALGTFVWHLGAHIFYTLVIIGLLMNKSELNQEEICTGK
jgi:hypothetical protein